LKGVIVAGGSGSRLDPITKVVGKQLLPVYDKPMVYYPLSVLMMAGIRDICIVTTPQERPRFEALLGDGRWLGCRFSYRVQQTPAGIADAVLCAADVIGDAPFAAILGDNIFHGFGLVDELAHLATRFAETAAPGAQIFTFPVRDPERYGILYRDAAGRPADIVEKPAEPRSREAIVGLYFYDHDAMRRARALKASPRGELEITDVNRSYLAENRLAAKHLGRGYAWFDAGTPRALMQASSFVSALEERQGLKINCPEEVAMRKGFVTLSESRNLVARMTDSSYRAYLEDVVRELDPA
jgi:glucose-1-phosphate thymidylyltransferase